MKRIITVCLIVALSLAVVCFSSCIESTTDKLREVNMALMQDYSKVQLKVTTSTEEATLNSKFVMTKSNGVTNIIYEIQRLNLFGNNDEIPSEYYSTLMGTATFSGGAITSINGDDLDELTFYTVVDSTMTFIASYLSDVKIKSNGISANVINPKGFLQNNDFEGTAMTVDVVMAESYLSSIVINYKLNDASITLDYEFTR